MTLSALLITSIFFTLSFDATPVKVATGTAAWPWARVETYQDLDPHFVQESFDAGDIDLSANDLASFDGATKPHSKKFLLHYGAHWDTAPQPVPVLLLPGAIRSASVLFHDSANDGTMGVAPYLASKGFKVFALTWGYNSGDNLVQAEQVANALERIRAITGAPKVDVIAASKGGMALRIYLSNLASNWRTAYRGDVRRALFIGAPLLGLDAMFRHSMYGMLIDKMMSWDKMLTPFGWMDTTAKSLYNLNRFVGHAQMLRRWDASYPVASFEPDWATSYYGGYGLMSHSYGIDAAAAAAGNLIDRLEAAGVAPGVQLAVLAGSKPYVIASDAISIEYQGPGDLTVFLDSALHTDGMTQNGATVIKKSVLFLNHTELLFDTSALQWMEGVLAQP
ncbi:MAG: hypothetical protein HZA54_07690 [Planctomycetes bacterium]|nr:hypothetical protein [Planctomycetota bacterium]